MSVRLFNKALTSSFQASSALLVATDTVVLDFFIDVGSDVVIQWYLEFSEDPSDTTGWAREVTQEVTGQGAVGHFLALRTFYPNGSTGPLTAVGSPYALETEFVRRAKFARAQIKAVSGAADVEIIAPFGSPVVMVAP
jgi:hypothetical protein